MKELGDGKVEEEMERSKKEGKEETKSEPPGPPPIGLIELVRFTFSFSFDKNLCSSSFPLPSMPS